MDYFVKLYRDEAALLDWVLTLHNWDREAYEILRQPDIIRLRQNAGRIIIGEEQTLGVLDEVELNWLLMIVPVIFHMGEQNVGICLKTKLYQALFGVDDASKDRTETDSGASGADYQAQDAAAGSPYPTY